MLETPEIAADDRQADLVPSPESIAHLLKIGRQSLILPGLMGFAVRGNLESVPGRSLRNSRTGAASLGTEASGRRRRTRVRPIVPARFV